MQRRRGLDLRGALIESLAAARLARRRRVAALAAIACAWPGGPAAAQASPAPLPDDVTLRFRAPEGCPTKDAAEAALAAELAERPTAELPTITIDAEVTLVEDTYELRLQFSGDVEGQRAIRATSCDAMATTTAVLTAMMLDEPVEAPAPVAPPPQTGAPGAASDEAAEPPSLRPGFGIALVLDQGSLPRATLGAALTGSVAVVTARLRLLLELAAYPGTVDALGGGARVELSQLAVALRGCTDTSLAPCAGFGVSALQGASRGVQRPGEASELVPAPELGAAWRLAFDRIARARVELRLAFPLRRSRFQVQDYPFSHRVGTVVARAAFGLDFEP